MKGRKSKAVKTAAIMAVLLVALSGCKADTPGPDQPDEAIEDDLSGSPVLAEPGQSSPTDSDISDDDNAESPPVINIDEDSMLDSPFSQQLHLGKIEGFPLALGDSAASIIDKLGEPEDSDVWGGSYYYAYEDYVLFTSSPVSKTDGYITLIALQDSFHHPIEGVQIGDTFAAIQDKLGDGAVSSNDDSDEWNLSYQVGEHLIIFVANTKKGPTTRVELYGWKQLEQ